MGVSTSLTVGATACAGAPRRFEGSYRATAYMCTVAYMGRSADGKGNTEGSVSKGMNMSES